MSSKRAAKLIVADNDKTEEDKIEENEMEKLTETNGSESCGGVLQTSKQKHFDIPLTYPNWKPKF